MLDQEPAFMIWGAEAPWQKAAEAEALLVVPALYCWMSIPASFKVSLIHLDIVARKTGFPFEKDRNS